MPRRSRNDIPPIAELDRPSPPADMPEAAAVVWRKAVGSMKPQWFGPEMHDLLCVYCGAMAEVKRLQAEFGGLNVNDPRYERLTARHDKMAAQALAYARALRLTPRGNSPRDCRDNGRHFEGAAPWDRTARRQVQPWEL
jgi:hypothetical protein